MKMSKRDEFEATEKQLLDLKIARMCNIQKLKEPVIAEICSLDT